MRLLTQFERLKSFIIKGRFRGASPALERFEFLRLQRPGWYLCSWQDGGVNVVVKSRRSEEGS